MAILNSEAFLNSVDGEILDSNQSIEGLRNVFLGSSLELASFNKTSLGLSVLFPLEITKNSQPDKELKLSRNKLSALPLEVVENTSIFQSLDTEETMVYYQNVLGVNSKGQQFLRSIQISPHIVGEYVKLSFPVDGDAWEDENGWLYFKPSGQTIGSTASGAKYNRDDLKNLFTRMWGNGYLQLFGADGISVERASSAEEDWNGNRRIALPHHPGARFVSPGQANLNEVDWRIGEVRGREKYDLPLRKHTHVFNQQSHGHLINQTPHTHNVSQTPHDHQLNQSPHAHEIPLAIEGDSGAFGGRHFDNSGAGNFNSSPSIIPLSIGSRLVDLSVESESINVSLQQTEIQASIEETGVSADFSIVTPSVCVEIVLFAGVLANPATPLE